MPEYTYLLENRLTSAQQHALAQVREAAREAGMTVFLAGGAVRDLTTGSSVRNLDFSIQGNALELQAAIIARGGELWGAHEPTRTLAFWFTGGTRVQVSSARTEEYPKPGKAVYHWSTIVEDLRRRDFTANAMALSLNEGSYGLLLDPLNGVADIEARLLRLGSNYGFIEDPSRLVRATRLLIRLGWQMEERTATRYANAKEADAMKALSPYLRGYELEKVASEEDALLVLKTLESEGWMEHLMPAWTSAKADVAGLENLRRNWIQLLMQGVSADLTATHLELLTARMEPKEIEALKKAMVHPGLVRQWEGLEESAKEFGRQLTGKAAATPSSTWKLLTTPPAEPILWLASTRKTGAGGGAVDAKFKNFFSVWPEFKKRVPAALMLEMRITPELPGYAELLEQLFYQLIDGNLETDEQMRAFLEPYSPPAPPPPPTVRRSRAKKSESKARRRTAAPDDEDEEREDDHEDDEEGEDAEDVEAIPVVVDDEDEDEADDSTLTASLGKLRLDPDELGTPLAEADDDDEDEDEDKVGAAPSARPVIRASAAAPAPLPASGASLEPAPAAAPAPEAATHAEPTPALTLAPKPVRNKPATPASKATPSQSAPSQSAPNHPAPGHPASAAPAVPVKPGSKGAGNAVKAVAAPPSAKPGPAPLKPAARPVASKPVAAKAVPAKNVKAAPAKKAAAHPEPVARKPVKAVAPARKATKAAPPPPAKSKKAAPVAQGKPARKR